MLKETTDSVVAIAALVAFIVLIIYLLSQDATLVGPI